MCLLERFQFTVIKRPILTRPLDSFKVKHATKGRAAIKAALWLHLRIPEGSAMTFLIEIKLNRIKTESFRLAKEDKVDETKR